MTRLMVISIHVNPETRIFIFSMSLANKILGGSCLKSHAESNRKAGKMAVY